MLRESLRGLVGDVLGKASGCLIFCGGKYGTVLDIRDYEFTNDLRYVSDSGLFFFFMR